MTTAPRFQPKDNAARQKIARELDKTLFVEASAGTGKTTSLVERVVSLVALEGAAIGRIAAITFTEAAAAELRDRTRLELEKAAADPDRSPAERERCRQGARDIGHASFQTLHSFASALLHERPLEAGLPPGFETTDAVASELRFEAAWESWLGDHLEGNTDMAPHMTMAFALGVRETHLRDIAKAFHENYSDLQDVQFGEDLTEGESGTEPHRRAVAILVNELRGLQDFCVSPDPSDKLYAYIDGKYAETLRLADAGLEPLEVYRRIVEIIQFKPGNVGSKNKWSISLKEVRERLQEIGAAVRRAALIPILRELQRFVLEYARKRREKEGRAEFQDLLVWTHELLRDNIEVRDHFRRRFSHLLIDESQDTDPIQAEIAMFLAEEVKPGTKPEDRPREWSRITPETGKLFVVGDPKQSIYRFRRADVNQMYDLRERMGGETVELTQNFRSQEPVTAWVNFLFQKWMGEGDEDGQGHIQSAYPRDGMEARWKAAGTRVWALADEVQDAPISQIREIESRNIADLIHQIVHSQWKVLDKGADNNSEENYRPTTYADICLLMPRRTGLRQLELALESANVPFRLESASLVFETQEIHDLMNCLKSIDNPSDHVATVAALRSPAFGCSDVDLFRHHENNGSFDYRSKGKGRGYDPVNEALFVLKNYHRNRFNDSPGALIDRFIRERLFMEAAVPQLRTREQWRRYRFMVEQARLFGEAAESGRNSLRHFLDWLQSQIDENARVTEIPVPEKDEEAVQVMTIHGSKGLEFPVVILTGINSDPRTTVDVALFNRKTRQVEVGVGSKDNRIATLGYEESLKRENQMQEAERVRLMYVACTRARDHLVLSLHRPASRSNNSAAKGISEHLKERPELWEPVLVEKDSAPPAEESQAAPASLEHSLEARNQWAEQRKAMLKEMKRPSFAAATGLDKKDSAGNSGSENGSEPEQDPSEPWRRGRAGTMIGRALHMVLQSADLNTGKDIDVWARAKTTAEGIPDRNKEVAQLAHRAIESPVVRRAVASGKYWREVPVAIPVGAGSIQGFVDLLFEEDGKLVVVDYKTDDAQDDVTSAIARYRVQGAAYALALQEATGKTVKEVIFLFPRREPAIEVPLANLASLTIEAKALALEQLGSR